MAANYWESTQHRAWEFKKDDLATMRDELAQQNAELVRTYSLPEARHLNIYFNQLINRLGKRLGIRQQALATAQMYMKRFYVKVEIRTTNPYLVVATALYLACKIEECPQHIRLIAGEARTLWPDYVGNDTSKLGECEFSLISEMHSQLIVFQPYRTLHGLATEMALPQEDVTLAWSVINDHYMTDLPLLYPPHVVAHTAILLALVLRPISTPGAQMQGGGSQAAQLAAGGVPTGASAASVAAGNAAKISQALNLASRAGGQPGMVASGGGGVAPPPPSKGDLERITRVQRYTAWLAETNVDIAAMVDCAQELISFYECYDQHKDKDTRDQINRFVKARGLDK